MAARNCQERFLSEEEKALWARRLIGRVTEDGFLLLDARPPLSLQETGERDGAQLWLQGAEDDWPNGWPLIDDTPGRCEELEPDYDPARNEPDYDPARNEEVRVMADGQPVTISRLGRSWHAGWCEDGAMRITVQSLDRDYVEAVAQGLRVRDISLARG